MAACRNFKNISVNSCVELLNFNYIMFIHTLLGIMNFFLCFNSLRIYLGHFQPIWTLFDDYCFIDDTELRKADQRVHFVLHRLIGASSPQYTFTTDQNPLTGFTRHCTIKRCLIQCGLRRIRDF